MEGFEWTCGSVAALLIIIALGMWVVCRIAYILDTARNTDDDEFDRRTLTIYDVETLMLRDFGIDASECAQRWRRIVSQNPNAKPFDIYIEVRQEFETKDAN